MLKGKYIVCFSGTNWSMPWGIAQRVMERFSINNEVLFIEYQPSFVHLRMKSLSHSAHEGRGSFRKINDNLRIYSPGPGLPFNNYIRAINISNQAKLAGELEGHINARRTEETIFWTFVPYGADFMKFVKNSFSVYHCGGNYPLEKKNPLRRATVSRMEDDVVSRCNMIVAQTRSLCEKFRPSGKNTFYLPSAIDSGYFLKTCAIASPAVEDEFSGIGRPRIGLVGYFDDNFYDMELLRHLVDSRKGWSFVFIGPVTGRAKRFNELRSRPNAFFLGYKEPSQLPRYIDKIDVGIIPYKVNDYMNAVSPNKFYEYLACGKTVVSTSLPDIKGYSDVLKMAGDKKEFLAGLDLFVSAGSSGSLKDKAIGIATENSIDRYMDRLSAFIDERMGR